MPARSRRRAPRRPPGPSTGRERASQLRRFAEWLDGPGAGAASLADAVDAYAESRFRAEALGRDRRRGPGRDPYEATFLSPGWQPGTRWLMVSAKVRRLSFTHPLILAHATF